MRRTTFARAIFLQWPTCVTLVQAAAAPSRAKPGSAGSGGHEPGRVHGQAHERGQCVLCGDPGGVQPAAAPEQALALPAAEQGELSHHSNTLTAILQSHASPSPDVHRHTVLRQPGLVARKACAPTSSLPPAESCPCMPHSSITADSSHSLAHSSSATKSISSASAHHAGPAAAGRYQGQALGWLRHHRAASWPFVGMAIRGQECSVLWPEPPGTHRRREEPASAGEQCQSVTTAVDNELPQVYCNPIQ